MADSQRLLVLLVSVEEAARCLGISTFTIRRLIKSGALAGVHVGRRLMIARAEIERVVTEGCGKHAGDA